VDVGDRRPEKGGVISRSENKPPCSNRFGEQAVAGDQYRPRLRGQQGYHVLIPGDGGRRVVIETTNGMRSSRSRIANSGILQERRKQVIDLRLRQSVP